MLTLWFVSCLPVWVDPKIYLQPTEHKKSELNCFATRFFVESAITIWNYSCWLGSFYLRGKYLGVELLSHMVNVYLTFQNTCSSCTIYIPQEHMWVLATSQHHVLLSCLSWILRIWILILNPESSKELFSFFFWPSACLCLEAALQKFKINLLIDFKHFPFVPTWRGFCFLSRRNRIKQTVLLPYFYFLYRHHDSSIGIGLKLVVQ